MIFCAQSLCPGEMFQTHVTQIESHCLKPVGSPSLQKTADKNCMTVPEVTCGTKASSGHLLWQSISVIAKRQSMGALLKGPTRSIATFSQACSEQGTGCGGVVWVTADLSCDWHVMHALMAASTHVTSENICGHGLGAVILQMLGETGAPVAYAS